jgi:hypothetical protein
VKPAGCKIVSGPHIEPGWGCCQPNCRAYNGMWRLHCKICGHLRCQRPPEPPPEPKVSLARLYKVVSTLGEDQALSPEFRALLGPLRVLIQHLQATRR